MADDVNLELPPIDATDGGAPPADAVPPSGTEPGAGAPLPDPVAYDLEADPAGILALDLKGAKLGGEFGTIKEALDALTAAREAATVPEAYDFGEAGAKWDADTVAAITADFREVGIPQSMVPKAVEKIALMAVEVAAATARADLMTAWNVTGEAFDAKLGQVAEWGKTHLPADVYATFRAMGPHGLQAVDSMMRAKWETPLWKGTDTGGGGDQKQEKTRAEILYGDGK